jgi:hypothetical protein
MVQVALILALLQTQIQLGIQIGNGQNGTVWGHRWVPQSTHGDPEDSFDWPGLAQRFADELRAERVAFAAIPRGTELSAVAEEPDVLLQLLERFKFRIRR